MTDRTVASMEVAIRDLKISLPKNAFQTATVDRGKEFACYASIEETNGLSFYTMVQFQDAFYEKGTKKVENCTN